MQLFMILPKIGTYLESRRVEESKSRRATICDGLVVAFDEKEFQA